MPASFEASIKVGSMKCQHCDQATPIILGTFRFQYVVCKHCRTVYKVVHRSDGNYQAIPSWQSTNQEPLSDNPFN